MSVIHWKGKLVLSQGTLTRDCLIELNKLVLEGPGRGSCWRMSSPGCRAGLAGLETLPERGILAGSVSVPSPSSGYFMECRGPSPHAALQGEREKGIKGEVEGRVKVSQCVLPVRLHRLQL